MLVPPQVNIIPLFFLMRQLHWINTYQALIIPGLFGGFGIFMMRQYFLSFSKDLEDSARIDGCNIFHMFIKIALPLIVTNTESMRTLPVGLAIFKGSFREVTLWGDLLACSVICTLPVVSVFLAGRKYLINDIMQGAVKE